MSPKSLLRHPEVISPISDFSKGGFKEVLDDDYADTKQVKRILFCSGKIYFDLFHEQQKAKRKDVAIVRIEQLFPFPEKQISDIRKKYKNCEKAFWVQEEPENMGGWQFVKPRLEAVIGTTLKYVGRKAAASPATGFPMIYRAQQAAISEQAFGRFSGK